MRYYKVISGGYINSIGIGVAGTEITQAEYAEILDVITNKPAATETTDYLLKEDLTWEEFELDPPDPEEPTAEEALAVLLGGAS